MVKRIAVAVALLLVVTATATGIVLAKGTQTFLFTAELVPTEDGPPKFELNANSGSGKILFNVTAGAGPEVGTYKGRLIANPGGPPSCSCPNDANTCSCVVQPGAVNFALSRR